MGNQIVVGNRWPATIVAQPCSLSFLQFFSVCPYSDNVSPRRSWSFSMPSNREIFPSSRAIVTKRRNDRSILLRQSKKKKRKKKSKKWSTRRIVSSSSSLRSKENVFVARACSSRRSEAETRYSRPNEFVPLATSVLRDSPNSKAIRSSVRINTPNCHVARRGKKKP